MPVTLDELRQVSGVGEKKLETYGAQIIALVTGRTDEAMPSAPACCSA